MIAIAPGHWRFFVVGAMTLWLVGLGVLTVGQSTQPFDAGIRTTNSGDGVVVSWDQAAGPLWDAGVRPGDEILGVNGRPPSPAASVALSGGDAVRWRRPAGEFDEVIGPSPALRSTVDESAFWANAFGFAVVGAVVCLLSRSRRQSIAFVALGTFSATGLIAALATPYGAGWALALVFIALLGAANSALALSMVFPDGQRTSGMYDSWLLLSIGTSLLVTAVYAWCVLFDPATYTAVQRLWLGTVSLQLLAACAMVARAALLRTQNGLHARRGIQLVALATAAGFAPFCLLSIGPDALGLGYAVPPQVAIVTVILAPASMAVCILHVEFPQLEVIVQRAALALLVWIVLLAAYTAGLAILQRIAYERLGISTGTAFSTGAVIVVAVFTLPHLQQRIRSSLDQRFFTGVYGYTDTLRSMTAAIVRLRGSETGAYTTLARLGQTLDLQWAAIVLRDELDAHGEVYCWGTPPGLLDRSSALGQLNDILQSRAPNTAETVNAVYTPDHGWLVPLPTETDAIGALLIGPKRRRHELSSTDLSLVVTLAPVLAVALENRTLVGRLSRHVDELARRERELGSLSARLLRVQEQERRRLALDLHDEPLQRAILLARELHEPGTVESRSRWRRSAEEIADSLRAISSGLRPPVLDDLGLVAAMERLVRDVQTRSDLEVSLAVIGGDVNASRLDRDLEVAMYRIAQEALNNCLKHARASRVQIVLEWTPDLFRVRVVDDGGGYVSAIAQEAEDSSGIGLLGMRERLRPWRGRVEVHAQPSIGTEVIAEVMLPGSVTT